MLLKYFVSNYKSIGHDIKFSMIPTKNNQDDRFTKTINTKNGEWKVLRRGALFGPNASGKSSFIESIEFARNYIVEGQKSGRRTQVNQFKGEFEDLKGITTFQFIFYIDGEVYDYGFSLDTKQVYEEWLMILTNNGFEPMFERKTDKKANTDIELTYVFGDETNKERILAEVLKETIKEDQKNQLFLYKLHDNAINKINKVFEWFENIQVIFPESKIHGLELKIAQNKDMGEFLSKVLSDFDTGVNRVFSIKKKVELKKLLKKIEVPAELIEEIYDKKSGIVEIGKKLFLFNDDDGEPILYETKLEHTLNNKTYDFNKDEESDGTQRLLDIIPILFGISQKSKIYFIDELDRSLHTHLTKKILSDFIENTEDANNQIIMTAHDVNIIDLNYMSQEEIWFLEKDKLGQTVINQFSNYDIKKDYDTVRAYLAGRFGAIPFIKGEY